MMAPSFSWCGTPGVHDNVADRPRSPRLLRLDATMRSMFLAGLLAAATCVGACGDDTKVGEDIKVANLKIIFAASQVAPAEDVPKQGAGVTPEAGGHDPSVQISFGVVKDPDDHGPLAKVAGQRIAAMKVRWADPKRFDSEKQAADFLRSCLSCTDGSCFTFQAWSQVLAAPILAADVEHAGGKPGQLLIWPSGEDAALYVYRDEASKWWFGTWEKLTDYRLVAPGHNSSVSSKASETETSKLIRAICKKIDEQLPELACKRIATEIPASARVWDSEEQVAAGFVRVENGAADPRELAKRELPYEALSITLAHYASPVDAQKDVERSLRRRPAMSPPKETYKGALLYRYSPGGTAICHSGPYVVELSPVPRSRLDPSVLMKALDTVLEQIATQSN